MQRALNNLEPARIGWGRAEEPTSVFNRRWFMQPEVDLPNPFGGKDKVRMNPSRGSSDLLKPAGPTDPEIAFFSVQSVDGRPIALLANYSLHYVGPGKSDVISADYFAVFADRIQQLLGADRLDPPFVGIMSNGTSGNINNINFFKAPEPGERAKPYEKMTAVAELVAQKVHEAHQNIEFREWVDLSARQQELTLAVRKPSQELMAYMQSVLNKPEDVKPYHVHEKVYARRLALLEEAPEEIDVILQAFRIGDLCVCAIPFEVFVEIGLEIKEKSPCEQSFTISLANGSLAISPHQSSINWGYETWMGTNTVELEASEKIVETLLGMLEEVQE